MNDYTRLMHYAALSNPKAQVIVTGVQDSWSLSREIAEKWNALVSAGAVTLKEAISEAQREYMIRRQACSTRS